MTKPSEAAWLTDNGNWRVAGGNNGEFGFFYRNFSGGRQVGDMSRAIGAVGGSNDTPSAVYDPNALPIRNGGLRRIAYRHSGGGVFVYMDGHVKWVKGEQVFGSVITAARRSLATKTTMFDVEQP